MKETKEISASFGNDNLFVLHWASAVWLWVSALNAPAPFTCFILFLLNKRCCNRSIELRWILQGLTLSVKRKIKKKFKKKTTLKRSAVRYCANQKHNCQPFSKQRNYSHTTTTPCSCLASHIFMHKCFAARCFLFRLFFNANDSFWESSANDCLCLCVCVRV